MLHYQQVVCLKANLMVAAGGVRGVRYSLPHKELPARLAAPQPSLTSSDLHR